MTLGSKAKVVLGFPPYRSDLFRHCHALLNSVRNPSLHDRRQNRKKHHKRLLESQHAQGDFNITKSRRAGVGSLGQRSARRFGYDVRLAQNSGGRASRSRGQGAR
jgi:hypothetical protein